MVIASGVMDQRHLAPFGLPSDSSSSFFSEELRIPERQVGFWKRESVVDQKGSKSGFSSPLKKIRPTGANSAGGVENPGAQTPEDQKTMLNIHNDLMRPEKSSSLPSTSWGDVHTNCRSQLRLSMKEADFVEPTSLDRRVPDYENGFFSSSFSEMFNNKLRLKSNGVLGRSVDTNNSSYEEYEPLESMEEMEAQTIGDLLPDDDDLISGVIDDFEYSGLSTIRDDADEDIFYTGGGMELETDDATKGSKVLGGFLNNQLSSEQPYSDQPSRTLFVRNINSNIEDSELRAIFQQYGDIHTLSTSCKDRGFVLVSYYDTRAAQNAIRQLQNKPLRRMNLDMHFFFPKGNPSDKDINEGTLVISNIDSSVSKDDLWRMLGVYGEIKEIYKAPTKCNHKFVEFYDVRAAESALHALSNTDISGQKIKLEPTHSGGARHCLTQQCSIELQQAERGGFLQQHRSSLQGRIIEKVASKSLENSSLHGQYPPVSLLMDKSLHEISPGVSQKSSSPIRIESIGQNNNQSILGELTESLGQRNFGRGMQVFHPHSVPEYHNSVSNNSNSIPAISMSVSSRLAEGVDCSRLHKVGSGSLHGHSLDQNGAFGVSGIGSCPVHGHHYVWNSSNAFQHNLSAAPMWSNSQPPVHVHGFPGVPPHLLNSCVIPLDQRHLGSAPAYGGNYAEMHSFHPGSLGSVGFPGSPQLYPSELAVFAPTRGNCREPMFSPVSVGFPSPQQRCHVIPGRNPMNISTSYDAPNDRIRSRRHDGSANHAENKKQYELDIERIAHGEDSRTTLMIKNIPNKYTCKMLLAVIDENHRGTYDFIYLPIDFKNKCNVGYAFINMTDPQHIVPFYKTFNGKKWEKFNSEKVASLAYARIQGRSALIAHFQNSSLMNEDKRCRPMLFHKDGPNAGDQEPFPVGNNIRSRSGRNRTFTNPDTQQESPSTSPNHETLSTGADSPSGLTEEPLE